MRRPNPARQQGFGLLVFVLLMAVVSFSLVLAYSSEMVRHQAVNRKNTEEAYLADVVSRVEAVWRQSSFAIDSPDVTNTIDADAILEAARIPGEKRMKGVLSDVLVKDGLTYRAILLYIPSETEEKNPPDLDKFKKEGVFAPCSLGEESECITPSYRIYSSYELQKEYLAQTTNRLKKVAYKAQAYFKARMLQDPERNIAVNYFRQPYGACVVSAQDVGCLDEFQPLTGDSEAVKRAARVLGLNAAELVTPWNTPIEVSNLSQSEATDPPFTMAFRAKLPNGTYKTVYAVQQL